MKWNWPQIRFTLLEFVLVPEEPADGQTEGYAGGCSGGRYELAEEGLEDEDEEAYGFGFGGTS